MKLSRATESVPALRMPPGATAPVTFDAIMEALRHLDELSRHIGSGRKADGSTLTGFASHGRPALTGCFSLKIFLCAS
ncbi:MAG: hypothetical protein E5X64_38085 [Mesorhizobium sp.]|nr:MAG: hypothetical protein EOR48_16335 [Mesorhizobium sp.]TIP45092.1 MAG: hypothetical protein E5X62_13745 [Mesorhizobium sp.]TIQ75747.1 MAG: hypothetical protein E5X64_38085 [Mesorhizobium sp.]